MKPFVTQVWPQFTADQQFCDAFGSVIVDCVELHRTTRQVVLRLRSSEPLDQALCGRPVSYTHLDVYKRQLNILLVSLQQILRVFCPPFLRSGQKMRFFYFMALLYGQIIVK